MQCPVCRKPLFKAQNAYRCAAGHNFDCAKQGYCNLLISNKPLHGDNKQMVEARRAFLSGGFYAPLADCVARIASENLTAGDLAVETGCGFGYYLDRIGHACAGARLIGTDISKDAVKLGARLYEGIRFFVANTFDLPIADGSAKLIVNVFSPIADAEYARVCARDGKLIFVTANPRHLWQLKETIYREKVREGESVSLDGRYRVLRSERVRFTMRLTSDQTMQLIAMTPYFYKTPREMIERLRSCGELDVEADFTVRLCALND